MDEIKSRLKTVMQTENRLTLPISGTGSAGMETSFVNLVQLGNPVLILKNGVFGMRMVDLASRLGAAVDVLEFDLPRRKRCAVGKNNLAGDGVGRTPATGGNEKRGQEKEG